VIEGYQKFTDTNYTPHQPHRYTRRGKRIRGSNNESVNTTVKNEGTTTVKKEPRGQ
jgi:hypothetical protein